LLLANLPGVLAPGIIPWQYATFLVVGQPTPKINSTLAFKKEVKRIFWMFTTHRAHGWQGTSSSGEDIISWELVQHQSPDHQRF
jgi:hypothetical protein